MSSNAIQASVPIHDYVLSNVKNSSIYKIFSRSITWLTQTKEGCAAINITIAGLYEIFSRGDYELSYDALTHAVTAFTLLCPTKQGSIVGIIMNLARQVWILNSIQTGDSIVPPLANYFDSVVHYINNSNYLKNPELLIVSK